MNLARHNTKSDFKSKGVFCFYFASPPPLSEETGTTISRGYAKQADLEWLSLKLKGTVAFRPILRICKAKFKWIRAMLVCKAHDYS